MGLKQKINNAIKVFRQAGFIGLVNASKKYIIKREYRPEEPLLIFQAINAVANKGIMIDVGAHYGTSIRPFVDAGWDIYAFEPDSSNRERLQEEFDKFNNVFIDNRAVSNQIKDSVNFYKSNKSTGISGLSSFDPSHQIGEEVSTTTLTHFFNEKQLNNKTIDFLKVDTEGFDLNVLKGVPWEKNSPTTILCEFEDKKSVPIGYTFHDIAQYLVDHGYKLIISEWHPIEEYGKEHNWNRFIPYPCQLSTKNSWGNILATKDDSIYNNLLNICKLKAS